MKSSSKTLSLTVSSTQSTDRVSPQEQLKAGKFDIEKPLLNSDSNGTSDTFEFNESAIDAFLASENVFPVDLTSYRKALEAHALAKDKMSSDIAFQSPAIGKDIKHEVKEKSKFLNGLSGSHRDISKFLLKDEIKIEINNSSTLQKSALTSAKSV